MAAGLQHRTNERPGHGGSWVSHEPRSWVETTSVALALVALAGSSVPPHTAAAAVVPIGSEFQVSASSTFGDGVDVAATPDGSFIVTWDRYDSPDHDYAIWARRFAAGGPSLGIEFRVTPASATYDGLSRPCCTATAIHDGRFVVTWSHGDYDIHARRFDSAGSPVGASFVVHDDTIGDHLFSDVSVQRQADFVAVWELNLGGNPKSDIFGRRFDSLGSASESRFLVSGELAGGDFSPRVATMPDDGLIVVWKNIEYGVSSRILGRLLDSEGQAAASAFVVDEQASAYLGHPAVAAANDGRVVVTGKRDEGVGGKGRILARRFGSDGAALGNEFVVGVETLGKMGYPDVAMLPDGGFIIVWGQFNVQPGHVFGREFGPDDLPRGEPFRVSTTFAGARPHVATDDTGGVVVVWAGPGLRAQRFTSNPMCGDANGDQEVMATDALQILRAAVRSQPCSACLCDVNGSGAVSATDALLVLSATIKGAASLVCPAC